MFVGPYRLLVNQHSGQRLVKSHDVRGWFSFWVISLNSLLVVGIMHLIIYSHIDNATRAVRVNSPRVCPVYAIRGAEARVKILTHEEGAAWLDFSLRNPYSPAGRRVFVREGRGGRSLESAPIGGRV
jgi:hypothetical protein